MDEAWNRGDGLPKGRPDPTSDDARIRPTRRSGSFQEPLGTGSPRNRGAGALRDGRRPGRGGSEPIDQRLDRWVSRGRELVDGVAGARPGSRLPGAEAAGLGLRGLGAGGLNPARLGRWVEERFDWLLEDDGDEDWREPWQQPTQLGGRRAAGPAAGGSPEVRRPERLSDPWTAPSPVSPSPRRSDPEPRRFGASERRGLEAISRRPSQIGTAESLPQPPAAEGYPAAADLAEGPNRGAAALHEGPEAWPDDAAFTLPRWQRTAPSPGQPQAEPPAPPGAAPARPLPRSTRRR
jgi:hypothetical protein